MKQKELNELTIQNGFKLRKYLMNEERAYLGERIGDILQALQNLTQDAPNMGKRHLMRLIANIVKQIRRILHSSWTFEEEQYLKELQKVGVALMKGLDTNAELPQLVASCANHVQQLSGKIDQPINDLAAPSDNKEEEN